MKRNFNARMTRVPLNPAMMASSPTRRRCALPAFQGWAMLGYSAVGALSASSGHSFMIGVYIEPIMADLSLSRSTVSALWSLVLTLSSVYVNVIGRVVDARGAPFVARVAALPYAAAVASLSLARGPASLALSFTLIRCLGPETLDFCFRNTVFQWWNLKRGRATAILNAAGATMMLLPAALAAVVRRLGWRAAARVWGCGAGLAAAAAAAKLVRRPEDVGQLPDGDAPAADARASESLLEGGGDEAIAGATLGEALRTRSYWMLQLYSVFGCLPWQGLNFHMAAVVAERGFDDSDLALVYTPLAISSGLGSVAGGLLLDALNKRGAYPLFALLLPLLAIIATLVLHFHLESRAGLVLFGSLLGMFQGSNVTVMTTMPATLFGRKHLGSIAASMYISGQLTSAAGSGVFGAAKDAAGTFGPLFQFLIACLTFQAALLVAEGGIQHHRKADPPRK